MRLQAKVHEYHKSMALVGLVSAMTPEEKKAAAEVIQEADIARLLHGTTVQKELKRLRSTQVGKVRTFLSALSKCKHTQSGVDVLFNKGVKI